MSGVVDWLYSFSSRELKKSSGTIEYSAPEGVMMKVVSAIPTTIKGLRCFVNPQMGYLLDTAMISRYCTGNPNNKLWI